MGAVATSRFDLGLQLENAWQITLESRDRLGSHGLFTWGDTSYECYMNSLEVIEMASEYIEKKLRKKVVFLEDKK